MSQYFEANVRPDTASAAIGQHLRVKTTGAVELAGATDVELGTMELPCVESGPCSIRLRNAKGTQKMIASGAISSGATVYAAASGKVSASGTLVVGQAMEEATANNDVIEVLRYADASPPFGVQTLTANSSAVAGNTVLPGINAVYVDNVTNDANDFIVLPALSSVPIGWAVTVIGQAGANFEVRTPATSGEEINSEDCDGTKEYLFTDTQIHVFRKIDNTIGWMGQGYTAIGAVVTAVVPD